MSSSLRRKKNKLFFLFFACSLFSKTYAANLTISPDTLFTQKGKTFIVSFFINGNESSINAVSAEVNYPKDLLKLNSFSKSGSILQMWSEEPSFSNTAGSAHFEGIILNPGFSGRKGLVVTASFTALTTGVATIRLTSGNIYANDGKATDVLSLLGTATYTILEKSKNEPLNTTSVTNTSVEKGEPLLSSLTHPNQESWYSRNDFVLTLLLDKKVENIKYSFSPSGKTIALKVSDPVSTLAFLVKEDGDYVSNVMQKVKGAWSGEAIYSIHIDTTPPYGVSAELPYGKNSSKIYQKISLSAKDLLSGVSHFEVSLNKSSPVTIKADDSGEAEVDLPKLMLKENIVNVVAYDMANNSNKISVPFFVSALDSPIVSTYTKEVKAGEFFNIQVKTYPNAKMLVSLQNNDTSIDENFSSDESGNASLKKILEAPGNYELYIKVVNFEDGESEMKKIGTVRVAYSFSWLFSAFNIQGFIFFLFGLLTVCVTAFVSIFATRKYLTKKSLTDKNNLELKSNENTSSGLIVKKEEGF